MPDNMLPGVGIFGTGPLAKIVVKMLKDHGFVITAVWSRTLKDAEMFAEEMNIPIATNKADGLLLKPEVGCVVIVCPPHLQSPIAVKAMGIGKHVVATWPAGTSQLEVLKMVKGATYYPSLLSMMCHGLRFLPSLTTMKEHINSGHIGDMFLFEVKVHCGTSFEEYGWECDSLMGGGALSMHGSYIIDILSYLSGKKAKSVNGMTRTYVKDTDAVHGVRQITCDDFCTFQLEMDEGITASCTVNSLCFGDFTLEVIAVGSKGRLTVRNHDLYVCLNDQKEELILHQGPKSTDDGNEDESLPTGRLPFPIGEFDYLDEYFYIPLKLKQ